MTIEELKKDIKLYDNETIHIDYDELLEQRLEELDPKFLKKIKRLVKDIDFWYA